MKKKILKKKLKKWLYISDQFGVIPMQTLQHPRKGAQDAFWLPSSHELGFMTLFHVLDKLSFNFYIDTDIEYKIVGKSKNKDEQIRLITKMKIDKVEMYPDEPIWLSSQ